MMEKAYIFTPVHCSVCGRKLINPSAYEEDSYDSETGEKTAGGKRLLSWSKICPRTEGIFGSIHHDRYVFVNGKWRAEDGWWDGL